MEFQKKSRVRNTLHIPNNTPPEDWCDFRKDYEKGMTLKEIGQKYMCDPRTVRQCIILNKSSGDLGKKSTPTITQKYESSIHVLLKEEFSSASISTLSELSRKITNHLTEKGSSVSERTIRNYLNTLPAVKSYFESQHRRNHYV